MKERRKLHSIWHYNEANVVPVDQNIAVVRTDLALSRLKNLKI